MAPLETVEELLAGEKFVSHGPVVGHNCLKHCSDLPTLSNPAFAVSGNRIEASRAPRSSSPVRAASCGPGCRTLDSSAACDQPHLSSIIVLSGDQAA